MTVRDWEIANATPQQRSRLRAQAIAESDDRPTFRHGDYELDVVSGPTRAGNQVTVYVQVTHVPSGTVIALGDANPFVFINPPTKIPDGTTHTETHPATGETYEVDNFVFAPRQAFRRMLGETVREAVRRSGWRP